MKALQIRDLPKEIEEKLRDHEEECRDYGHENINEMGVTRMALCAAIQAALEAKDREIEAMKEQRDYNHKQWGVALQIATTARERAELAEKERDEARAEVERLTRGLVERLKCEVSMRRFERDSARTTAASRGDALQASLAREAALRFSLTQVALWLEETYAQPDVRDEGAQELLAGARAALATPPRQEGTDDT